MSELVCSTMIKPIASQPGFDGVRRPSVSLDDLVTRARAIAASGRRSILGIAATPGAGKSTLCTALIAELGNQAVLVGMDGFHFANRELDRLGRRGRKGAPDTFDVDGYVALLQRLRQPHTRPIYVPVFDRGLEESIGSAAAVLPDTSLVITEGNYLLLDDGDWAEVRQLLDEAWFLDVDAEVREERLVRRRQSFGDSPADAQTWVHQVDLPNAARIEATRQRADLVVHLHTP